MIESSEISAPPGGDASTAGPSERLKAFTTDADARDATADERDVRAEARETTADERDVCADAREAAAGEREIDADGRQAEADRRELQADAREQRADGREAALDDLARATGVPTVDHLERSYQALDRAAAAVARTGLRLHRTREALGRSHEEVVRDQGEIDRETAAVDRAIDGATTPVPESRAPPAPGRGELQHGAVAGACGDRVRVAHQVTREKHEVSNAREAADALRRVTARVEDSPDGELDDRSAEVLDELVRLAELLGRTVEDVTGEESRAVRACAEELAAAIAARRGPRGR